MSHLFTVQAIMFNTYPGDYSTLRYCKLVCVCGIKTINKKISMVLLNLYACMLQISWNKWYLPLSSNTMMLDDFCNDSQTFLRTQNSMQFGPLLLHKFDAMNSLTIKLNVFDYRFRNEHTIYSTTNFKGQIYKNYCFDSLLNSINC